MAKQTFKDAAEIAAEIEKGVITAMRRGCGE